MRCQLVIAILLVAAACGRSKDKAKDEAKPSEAATAKGEPASATPAPKACPPARFAIELADEKSAVMKAMFDHADKDKNAPKLRVYAQLDEWKDATGAAHTDYRLAGSDRAIIESYLAARGKDDPRLAPAADRAFRFEKTFASGQTYWRTHYVIAPPVLDGSGVQSAEIASDDHGARVIVRLTPDGKARLAAATAANAGKKLVIRAGDTVMATPVMDAAIAGDPVMLTMAEETPELDAEAAAQVAKQLSCAP